MLPIDNIGSEPVVGEAFGRVKEGVLSYFELHENSIRGCVIPRRRDFVGVVDGSSVSECEFTMPALAFRGYNTIF